MSKWLKNPVKFIKDVYKRQLEDSRAVDGGEYMNAQLLEKLRRVTEQEKKILAGRDVYKRQIVYWIYAL